MENFDKNDVLSIGITNQRETTCVWDSKTGEPLHNAIGIYGTYMCVLIQHTGTYICVLVVYAYRYVKQFSFSLE